MSLYTKKNSAWGRGRGRGAQDEGANTFLGERGQGAGRKHLSRPVPQKSLKLREKFEYISFYFSKNCDESVTP